jgi:hypothetical protein
LRRFAEQDVDAVEASNWLLGAGVIGGSGRPVRLVNRIKTMFGPESEPYTSIRQAMWMRLTRDPRGGVQPGPQEVTRRLSEFLNGKGSALAQALYTPREIAQMRRFTAVVRSTIPDSKSTNPSRTAFANSRLLSDAGANIMGLLGFVGGGVDAGIAARLGVPLFRNTVNAARARRAVNRPLDTVPLPTTGGAVSSGLVSEKVSGR